MKKISLKDVKNSLRRDEMRMISGGSGYKTPECTEECSSNDFCSSNTSCPRCVSGKCAA